MAYEALIGSDIGVLKAAADLSAKQYCFVKADTAANDQVAICADEADNVLGVVQNTPVLGEAVQLRVVGITKIKLGGTVTRGDRLGPKSDGTAISILTGVGESAGIALQSGLIGDIISMLLVPQSGGYKIARGIHRQAAAADTVVTGLNTVVAAVVSFSSAPTVKQLFAAVSIGNQAGAPAAGSIIISTFKPTAVNDVTPLAATDFTDNIDLAWVAVGT